MSLESSSARTVFSIRMHANDINGQSRYGSGVRVVRLIGEDKVAVLARVDRDATAETAKPEDDGETNPTPEELEAIAAAEAAEEAAEDAAPDTEGGGRRIIGVTMLLP